jgi:hypothetical protein
MTKIVVVFTKREWNPGSYAIRWALPRTRFHVARASHCLIKDGDYFIEASMTHGTRRVLADEALNGLTIVATIEFEVPDAEAGLAWGRTQVDKPYDYSGALGLAVAPDRDWMEPDKWFCFELAAAIMAHAGRDAFRDDAGHITGAMLMAIKP